MTATKAFWGLLCIELALCFVPGMEAAVAVLIAGGMAVGVAGGALMPKGKGFS